MKLAGEQNDLDTLRVAVATAYEIRSLREQLSASRAETLAARARAGQLREALFKMAEYHPSGLVILLEVIKCGKPAHPSWSESAKKVHAALADTDDATAAERVQLLEELVVLTAKAGGWSKGRPPTNDELRKTVDGLRQSPPIQAEVAEAYLAIRKAEGALAKRLAACECGGTGRVILRPWSDDVFVGHAVEQDCSECADIRTARAGLRRAMGEAK